MSALTTSNVALKVRPTDAAIVRNAKASTAIQAWGFVQKDVNGDVLPLDTTAGIFVGISEAGILSGATDRKTIISQRGHLLATITSIAKGDLGKPVWCSTDNPADVTLTYASGAKQVGWVADLEYDSNGAIANKCWVYYDAQLVGRAEAKIVCSSMRTLVGTVEQCPYECPEGRKAIVLSQKYEYEAKPNYATSSVLITTKISGTTRTTLQSTANLSINNTAVAIDTPTALTPTATAADLLFAAGDRLANSVVQVGAETAAGNVKVRTLLLESQN